MGGFLQTKGPFEVLFGLSELGNKSVSPTWKSQGQGVDASELAGAGGKEPALASLAENGRAPSGACTDAGIGVLWWCVAAFELREARVPGAAGFVRVISARRACPDAAGGVNVASAGKRRDAATGELRRSAGA